MGLMTEYLMVALGILMGIIGSLVGLWAMWEILFGWWTGVTLL